ncbi:PAS domain-containing protein [Peredibacter sp. HCB2-198]|uniref:PAS domain-containing protein n=1 Tax=Peredibacter sp. HCB2-198 TaxID=3383025 RepID=UPI0038B4A541
MKKPIPVPKEVPFEAEELFFSTTDLRGIIQFGNDVFIRISGYPSETILGAPHNIIRHPDMPKSVFKLFWDTLKANKPIGAYVKNMAADGRYYWVFAFAFPVNGGYLSIRFKPSSKVFDRVQEIYAHVLAHEKETSMDDAAPLLHELIRKEGFRDYEDFMVQATILELSSRDKTLKASKETISNDHVIQDISEVTSKTATSLDQNFAKISAYQKSNEVFINSVNMLENEFNKLKFLSINMKILAGNFGDEAVTLGVISEEFSNLATKIEEQLTSFSSFVHELQNAIKHCSLHLAALKTQMIMVDFFVKESINKLSTSENAFAGMLQNREVFTSLFTHSIKTLAHELEVLQNRLNSITTQIKDIQKFISGLEVIKQIGAIESARTDEVKKSFDYYLTEMDSFTTLLSRTISTLNEQRDVLSKNTNEIYQSSDRVSGNIERLFEMALLKG